MDKAQFMITEETGKTIKEWCNAGINVNDIEVQIDQCTTIDGLWHILIKYPEFRKKLETDIHYFVLSRPSSSHHEKKTLASHS
jgi:hypothetical protein